MDDFDSFAPYTMATRTRPLLGLTVLAVEDSRFASDTLREMCVHSGARIRRADCLQSAKRHLQVYRPSVAIIDLGLPDGSGLGLIEELDQASPRVDIIIAISGDDNAEAEAMTAGADGFLAKPFSNLGIFQQMILQHMPEDRRPAGPHPVSQQEIAADPQAYQDDMAHVATLLTGETDAAVLDYVVQFLSGVARSADDSPLCAALDDFTKARAGGHAFEAQQARLAAMIQARTERCAAI